MGFIVPGKTTCSLCGDVICADDESVSFPHFLGVKHPLSFLSEGSCHKLCFEEFDSRNDFLKLLELYYYACGEEDKINANDEMGWIKKNLPHISTQLCWNDDWF